jgi:hypothetical protein
MYGWEPNSFYESEWGIGITFFSLLFSSLAPYIPSLQSIAVISVEMAMGFNILITPIFWIFLAPGFLPNIFKAAETPGPLQSYYKYLCFSEPLVHLAPLICSIF